MYHMFLTHSSGFSFVTPFPSNICSLIAIVPFLHVVRNSFFLFVLVFTYTLVIRFTQRIKNRGLSQIFETRSSPYIFFSSLPCTVTSSWSLTYLVREDVQRVGRVGQKIECLFTPHPDSSLTARFSSSLCWGYRSFRKRVQTEQVSWAGKSSSVDKRFTKWNKAATTEDDYVEDLNSNWPWMY